MTLDRSLMLAIILGAPRIRPNDSSRFIAFSLEMESK